MDVELVRWPMDAARLHELRDSATARLVLVATSARAPMPTDDLEDWVRLPATDEDIRLRVEVLRTRLMRERNEVPVLDSGGLLHFRGTTMPLPPMEIRLVGALLARYGAVVARDQLTTAGWPGEQVERNVLDVHILRLRRRLGPLGLIIRNVRNRGYLMDAQRAA
jgi:two-component system, OmpR family, response regulator